MKWPRWIPRLLTESVPAVVEPRRTTRIATPTPAERLGIRDVGHCEVCGRSMQARTRHEEFRGRVDCDCGTRNHVEYRSIRTAGGVRACHITVTTGRRFEAAMHKPDLRLPWRYGICPSCGMAVSLLDARVVAHEDADGSVETIAYYCDACHVDDDVRRGRLMGHDGSHVVDTLRFLVTNGVR